MLTTYRAGFQLVVGRGSKSNENPLISNGKSALALENHLKQVPEDARARILLAVDDASNDRAEDALRETNLAVALRPNEAMILYNAACNYCVLKRKTEAMDAIKKAWDAGYRDADWARRDPDLALLLGDPEFEKLFPASAGAKA